MSDEELLDDDDDDDGPFLREPKTYTYKELKDCG
jgi:hypothetical protein